jgi:thiol-disulfide isomerase/thioredoxin
VSISDLKASTEYYVKAVSQDASGLSTELGRQQPVSTPAPISTGINVGNRAPAFTLSSITGSSVSLSSLRGKIVMLNFWATWCGPCLEEMPYMQAIQSTWAGDTELAIVTVNVQESFSVVEAYIKSQGYTFTVLMDPGDLKDQYSVINLPTTYFIDSQGIIRQTRVGSFDTQKQIMDIIVTID